jgi:hypothetical protein
MKSPFFAPDSFWNTPLPTDITIHPDNERLIEFSRWSIKDPGVHINLHAWTVPLYYVDAETPLRPVARRLQNEAYGRRFRANSLPYLHEGHPEGHDPSFGPLIPIPAAAEPDRQTDAHLAIIDENKRQAWDMWAAHRTEDGEWEACTGISYSLDGSGVFDPKQFNMHNGESVHLHGPGRAVGVPIIAGVILHDEIVSGHIEHKLSFAALASGLLAHYYPPTIWTDGGVPGGIPAGAILQLDPALDLDTLNLTPGARVVAKALQEYGAALVDFAGGFTLYGEGLWGDTRQRSWENTLEEDSLFGIDWKHFRYLAPECCGQVLVEKGMIPLPHDGVTAVYRDVTGITPEL